MISQCSKLYPHKTPITYLFNPKRFQLELEAKIPALIQKVEQGFTLTGQALTAVQGHLEVQKKMQDDLSSFAAEYHGDKVSHKYALAAITNLGEKVKNIEWKVSGGKQDVNNSMKSLTQKLLTQVSQMNSNAKSHHEALLGCLISCKISIYIYICIYIYNSPIVGEIPLQPASSKQYQEFM